MRAKEQHFHSILDIYSFRVVVDSIDTCYRVLGLMHALYKPRPFQVKDYIAVPKTNGYQSLHTAMIGHKGMPIDVLIRTEEMDQMARLGVAAHWGYQTQHSTSVQLRVQQWLNSIAEMQQSAENAEEFIENVKSDLFSSDIYVFTPKGRIVQLPAKATAVDFAYAVHTDVGDRCIGAIVDHLPYALSQPLQSGQTIEIQMAASACLNALWLNSVVTARARSGIRNMLKRQQQGDALSLGRQQLLLALNLPQFDNIDPLVIETVLAELKRHTLDELLTDIGLGTLTSQSVAESFKGKIPSSANSDTSPLSSDILIDLRNTQGSLAEVSTLIADLNSNIIGIQSQQIDDLQQQLHLKISITDDAHLATLLHHISRLDVVIKVGSV